ncbi:hypothetical protein GCM10009105_03090 [Dokdonella soli]|uniref:Uncharacterized protein n=1 Tax=Dokdonella soli TaxID=529810 RepID=A0ABN1IC03_9GAMM
MPAVRGRVKRKNPLSPNGSIVGGEGWSEGAGVAAKRNLGVTLSSERTDLLCIAKIGALQRFAAPPPHPALSPKRGLWERASG